LVGVASYGTGFWYKNENTSLWVLAGKRRLLVFFCFGGSRWGWVFFFEVPKRRSRQKDKEKKAEGREKTCGGGEGEKRFVG